MESATVNFIAKDPLPEVSRYLLLSFVVVPKFDIGTDLYLKKKKKTYDTENWRPNC